MFYIILNRKLVLIFLPTEGTLGSDIFSQVIGPEYIAIALRAAKTADPNVKLWVFCLTALHLFMSLTHSTSKIHK